MSPRTLRYQYLQDLDSLRQMTETSSGHIIVGSKKGSEVIALMYNDDGVFEQRLVANNLQNPAGVVYFEGDLYFAEMIQSYYL